MSSSASQLHVDVAVNGLLARMLPGALQSDDMGVNSVQHKPNGSKAQLIDRNLKKRVELQELDMKKLKRRQSRIRRRDLQRERKTQEGIRKSAEQEILESHKREHKLTKRETKYLNRLISINGNKAESWKMDEDVKTNLLEIQKYILDRTMNARKVTKNHSRRQKKKLFKENKKGISSAMAQRYPGLTPGLAPVDMSDEEESSEEEEGDMRMEE